MHSVGLYSGPMNPDLSAWLHGLPLPELGLASLALTAFVSATLLPMGSEAVLLALVAQSPDQTWPAVAVATAFNTLGGCLTWLMGRWAQRWLAPSAQAHARAQRWLQAHGPKTLLLSWVPVVGDPLCAVAGWLRLPFGSCLLYMALGKAMRYAALAALI